MHQITELKWNTIIFERATAPFSGEQRYLERLWVSCKKGTREELHQSGSSQSKTNEDKIRAAIKLLAFRNERVLVQFWSPHPVGKPWELTTVDRPYGFGAKDDILLSYRKFSECNVFVVEEDCEEFNPCARVFMRGLPEWTSDLSSYSPKAFPQQYFAIHCNFLGYLVLPVFDSTTRLCVGVLEFLTSSKHTSFAYEVQQIHAALKTENLTSPQAFDCPASNVPNECRQNKLDKINSILKDVCDIHRLPLAQTWAVTPSRSFVSFEKVLVKSCSSFDTRCIGKVCMSTTALPFNVRELCMWPYRNASKGRHLEKFRGVVGTAFSSRGSCFCRDVTKLSEEEYPLVHHARMNKITGCLAIFLRSVESNDDYVLEFVLPLGMIDGGYVLFTETLKQKFEAALGFELGDTSSIQKVGPSTDLSVYIQHDIIQTSSNCMAENSIFHSDSSDSNSMMTDIATTDSASFPDQWSSTDRSVVNIDAREKSNPFKQGKNVK